MKIGELARAGDCLVETVRYYEREGLLPPPARSVGNYRVYAGEHLQRLTFIRHCRSLGMTLADIRKLLHFKDASDEHCDEVNALLDSHIDGIKQRMAELRTLESELLALRATCKQARVASECGILQGLGQAGGNAT